MDCGIVRYRILEVVETGCIVAPGNPELEITAAAVFFFQVGYGSFDMTFTVEVGIMCESKLYRAADDGLSVDDAVGFRHDLAVDAAWSGFAGCTVVFCGLCYQLDLFLGEPFLQTAVVTDYYSGIGVMVVASVRQPEVVTGSCGEKDFTVDFFRP